MRILHRYITVSFLITFVLTLVVFTFVMSIGLIFRVNTLLVRGVLWRAIGLIVLSGVPELLSLSIPISLITASLLVFGRLSADNEITAIRACGVSVEQIMVGPLLVGALLSSICVYVNQELAPRGHLYRRSRKVDLAMMMRRPMELLEEGRFITFNGLKLYIRRMDDENLYNVYITDTREQGLRREVRAKQGRVRQVDDGLGLVLELYDVVVDPYMRGSPEAVRMDRWSIPIPNVLSKQTYTPSKRDMTMADLWKCVTQPGLRFSSLDEEGQEKETMALSVEFNERLALAYSCFAFVLLGVPLGIKAYRKESTIGVLISLVLVGNFYVFIIVAESLARRPELHPDMIVWVPVVLALVIGTRLVKRNM